MFGYLKSDAIVESSEEVNVEVIEDEHIDKRKSHMFEFIETPCYISVLSPNSAHELFYLFKVIEKCVAQEDCQDIYGHKIFKNELYLKGYYLEKQSDKKTAVVYKLLDRHLVYIHINEIHQTFIDFDECNMSMTKEEYLSLILHF